MKGAGRLNEPVSIVTKTFTVDDFGAHVDDVTTSTTVWAEVIHPGSVNESIKAAQVYPERSVTFIIRHPNPTNAADGYTFNEQCTITYMDDVHEIIGIAPLGRRDGLKVYCKKRGTTNV